VHADYTHLGGHAAAIRLLGEPPRPDTLVCANDSMALGAIDACRHTLGLAVPGAIAIAGFDDAAVYDGSWCEWGGENGPPVLTG
jgi:DNA-binding LacI/PurR family transcriptional regulator